MVTVPEDGVVVFVDPPPEETLFYSIPKGINELTLNRGVKTGTEID